MLVSGFGNKDKLFTELETSTCFFFLDLETGTFLFHGIFALQKNVFRNAQTSF